jgi:hypothetical protein
LEEIAIREAEEKVRKIREQAWKDAMAYEEM